MTPTCSAGSVVVVASTPYSPSPSPVSVRDSPAASATVRSKPSGPVTTTSTRTSFGFASRSAPSPSWHSLVTSTSWNAHSTSTVVSASGASTTTSPAVRAASWYSPSGRSASRTEPPASTVTFRWNPPGPVTVTSTGTSFGLSSSSTPPASPHAVETPSAWSWRSSTHSAASGFRTVAHWPFDHTVTDSMTLPSCSPVPRNVRFPSKSPLNSWWLPSANVT